MTVEQLPVYSLYVEGVTTVTFLKPAKPSKDRTDASAFFSDAVRIPISMADSFAESKPIIRARFSRSRL
jgi:hypothetical protein